jgi:hypothetical protein
MGLTLYDLRRIIATGSVLKQISGRIRGANHITESAQSLKINETQNIAITLILPYTYHNCRAGGNA